MPRERSRGVDALTAQSQLFAALGDETRLELVDRLSERGPLSISELAAGSEVSRQAVTKHLFVLRDAGLVHGTRKGKSSLWQLEPPRLEEARHYLSMISVQWDQVLDRLKKHVDG